MLYLFLGVLGSNPPVSFVSGSLLFYPTVAALLAAASYCLSRRVPGWRTFLMLSFVMYASMVIEITLFPMPISFAEIASVRADPSLFISPDLNLVPLRSILVSARSSEVHGLSTFLRNWFGNLLLLMPLGFLAPAIWNRFRSAWQMTLLCVAVSLSIELAQYVGSFLIFRIEWKSADIDDVIVNVAGALLGFLVYVMLTNVHRALRSSTT